jgi:hypothetical protein
MQCEWHTKACWRPISPGNFPMGLSGHRPMGHRYIFTYKTEITKVICKGCFFQNETAEWTLIKIGEIGYNGLIRHSCDRYKDNPGIVQYHAEVICILGEMLTYKIAQYSFLNLIYFRMRDWKESC